MGRKTVYHVGQRFGGLEVKEVIPSMKMGTHVKLRCLCHYCNNEKVMYAGNIKRRNSCGCQQNNSSEWKNVGPKNKPWQLASGEAAKRNVEYQYKRSAEKRKIEYSLTQEEFESLVVGECHYCGDSLTNIKKGQGKTSGDFRYTGIDRIDSKKGYTKENCVPCCWKCNNMKHTTDIYEFISHVKKICKKQDNIWSFE